jgi:hypothetical protein
VQINDLPTEINLQNTPQKATGLLGFISVSCMGHPAPADTLFIKKQRRCIWPCMGFPKEGTRD